MPGRFYGVGVGPGDPELLTLKALNVLAEVPVIAHPFSSEGTKSYALDIIRPHVDTSEKEIVALHFPMTKDPSVVEPMWERALSEITKRLDRGLDVAFVTEGDPFLYSTFIHLYRRLWVRRPDVPITVIPGVTSVTAASVQARVPLADRDESVAIIPATYGTEMVVEALERFDTVVLMKVSSRLPEILSILERKGLSRNAFIVEKATSGEERVVRGVEGIRDRAFHYLSTMIVTPKKGPWAEPPLLILVHGSPVKAATLEMGGVADAVRRELPGVEVINCHLEHSQPDLATALGDLKRRGHDNAVIVPYFLFKAKHLKEEVPEILQTRANGLKVTLTEPLWPHDSIIGLLEERARAAMEVSNRDGDPRLLLVGRGSSDPAIPPLLSRISKELSDRMKVESTVGFSDVIGPSVEDTVLDLLSKGAGPIIALPLFLSHGALTGEIIGRIRGAMNGRNVPFSVAEPLGPDPCLSRIVVQRYREALAA